VVAQLARELEARRVAPVGWRRPVVDADGVDRFDALEVEELARELGVEPDRGELTRADAVSSMIVGAQGHVEALVSLMIRQATATGSESRQVLAALLAENKREQQTSLWAMLESFAKKNGAAAPSEAPADAVLLRDVLGVNLQGPAAGAAVSVNLPPAAAVVTPLANGPPPDTAPLRERHAYWTAQTEQIAAEMTNLMAKAEQIEKSAAEVSREWDAAKGEGKPR
jgi:hypothetical protein